MFWRIQRVWLNVIEYGEYDGHGLLNENMLMIISFDALLV